MLHGAPTAESPGLTLTLTKLLPLISTPAPTQMFPNPNLMPSCEITLPRDPYSAIEAFLGDWSCENPGEVHTTRAPTLIRTLMVTLTRTVTLTLTHMPQP